jgi:glutathione S-transferase
VTAEFKRPRGRDAIVAGTMYTLHGFSQSGNTYKVAMLLQALQQPWKAAPLVFADFAAGLTRGEAWRRDVNEMGEVPILEVDGRRRTQSGAIMTFLADRHGRYGGRDADERHEVLRWLLFDNHKFTSYFATFRFNKSFGPTAPDPAVTKWLKGRIDNAFGIVEKHLTGRDYMVGEAPTIADLSLAGYLYFPPEESGIDIAASYPAMTAWLARLRELPGWKPPYELLPGERIPPRW